MTTRRPGQWPGDKPVALVPTSPSEQPGTPVKIHVADVRLVVTVDLTGDYATAADVSRDFYEQTRRSSDCHTAIVRVGEAAASLSRELGKAIAGEFFLTAKQIEIHVPAGSQHTYLAGEAQRYVGFFCTDYERMKTTLRNPG